MAWSTLQRKTPLRAKTGFKPSTGFKLKSPLQLPKSDSKTSLKGKTKPKKSQEHRSSLTVKLDLVFSAYIRLRDAMPAGMTRCISCGKILPFEQMQCGHYHTRHNLSVRWDERNCNSECAFDNCHNPNHLDGYKQNLIEKIGQVQFDELNTLAHQSKKWSNNELREMIQHYTAEVKRLSKEKGISMRT